MPTLLRGSSYRAYFYSNERGERPHVHVESNGKAIKVWLDKLSTTHNYGFTTHEVTTIISNIGKHKEMLLKKWSETFDC